MEVIADLHIHSKYSRAVSQQMIIPEIAQWAIKKGIGLVGTGDWTHPLWLRELKENLEEAGEGVYKIKNEKLKMKNDNAKLKIDKIYFLLSTEIASIYTQDGKPHRIHNLVLAPNFSVVEKINEKLRNAGVNLLADGRPMTGISSRDLTELVMEEDKNCLVISAHAWTPWYSLYGSQSGFDSINECYQDMAKYIYAIETGLSSSPAMNWRIEELDNRSIVSFSDAHSGAKLGREATVFEVEELGYETIRKAIVGRTVKQLNSKTVDSKTVDGNTVSTDYSSTVSPPHRSTGIAYTIEFYPEEGKYHWTGHRNCGVKQSPEETEKLGATCPVCARRLTVGVMHRVEELASRPPDYRPENRPPYKMLVPLIEILAEALGAGVSSQIVENEYNYLTEKFGSEFDVLLKTPIEEIAKIGGERLAEGILRVRSGQVFVDPGYDGVFGTVRIWSLAETQGEPAKEQMSLF